MDDQANNIGLIDIGAANFMPLQFDFLYNNTNEINNSFSNISIRTVGNFGGIPGIPISNPYINNPPYINAGWIPEDVFTNNLNIISNIDLSSYTTNLQNEYESGS